MKLEMMDEIHRLKRINAELLEALKKLYREVDALVFTNDKLEIARLEARAAIAKAEGRE